MSFFGIPIRNGLSLGLGTVASLTNGPGFLPDELFYGGTVQGAWYDPSDLTTLFQDSAGTTPVTAVEQPVGLMLDKSKGLVLGPELVTNGDFSQGTTGWTISGAWAASGGQFVKTGASNATANQSILTVGKFYRITIDIVAVSGTFLLYAGSAVGYSITSVGTKTFTVQCVGDTNLYLQCLGVSTATIDNVSVREVPGNHAYQTTSASRPTLRARYNLLTRSEEFNDTTAWQNFVNGTGVTPVRTANAGVAPDGTTTADRLQCSRTTAVAPDRSGVFGSASVTFVSGTQYTVSVWLKSFSGTNQPVHLTINANGAVDQNLTATSDWQRFTYTFTSGPNITTNTPFRIGLIDAISSALSSDFLIWGAQLTQTAVFPSNTYQRIGASTDYATGAAFPPYLAFDGVDDSLLTNSVDFATVTSDGQARRNLLLNPTQFDVTSSWTTDNATVTANTGTAPDGTTTADTLTSSGAALVQRIRQAATQTGQVTFSVYAKAGTAQFLQLLNASDGNCFANFDLSAGTVGTSGTGSTSTISNAGSGWYRCTITYTLAASSNWQIYIAPSASATYGQSFTATVAALQVWGAQLETGSSATAFQNIGTDKMALFAGICRLTNTTSVIAELSANVDSNNGGFGLFVAGSGQYEVQIGVVANRVYGVIGTYNPPISNVMTMQFDSAQSGTAEIIPRVNGATPSTVSLTRVGDGMVGNFGNYPLYIGRRNNATLPFNGNLYSLIIAGQSYSSGQISSTESWVAAKTPLGTI